MTMGKAVAEAAFHREVRHFAYPFGDRDSFRRAHVVMAQEAGFCERGVDDSGHRRYRGPHQSACAAADRLGRPASSRCARCACCCRARHSRRCGRRGSRRSSARSACPGATSSSRSASPAAPSPCRPRHRRSPAAGRNCASHGICATAMPVSAQTAARSSRAMAPKNLRVRMVMTEMSGFRSESAACAGVAGDYKGRENSFKFRVQMTAIPAPTDQHLEPRRPRLAVRRSQP